jgi:uncharacterized protein YjbI with pentapeptide repeats
MASSKINILYHLEVANLKNTNLKNTNVKNTNLKNTNVKKQKKDHLLKYYKCLKITQIM